MSTLDEKMQSKYTRRWVIIICIVLLFLCIFVRISLDGFNELSVTDILKAILDNIIPSIIITIILTISSNYLFPPQDDEKIALKEITATDIPDAHDKAMEDVKSWWYLGPVGKYFRDNDLPKLVNISKSKDRSINITVLIMDPDLDNINDFNNFRRDRIKQSKEDTKDLRINLIITILYLLKAKAFSRRLAIKIGLLDYSPVFRYDISNTLAIITTDTELRHPGIRSDAGTFFYQGCEDELCAIYNKSRRIEISSDTNSYLSIIDKKKISVADIKEVLSNLNIRISGISDVEINLMIQKVQSFLKNNHS